MNLESFQVGEYRKLLEGQGNSTPCPVHLFHLSAPESCPF